MWKIISYLPGYQWQWQVTGYVTQIKVLCEEIHAMCEKNVICPPNYRMRE